MVYSFNSALRQREQNEQEKKNASATLCARICFRGVDGWSNKLIIIMLPLKYTEMSEVLLTLVCALLLFLSLSDSTGYTAVGACCYCFIAFVRTHTQTIAISFPPTFSLFINVFSRNEKKEHFSSAFCLDSSPLSHSFFLLFILSYVCVFLFLLDTFVASYPLLVSCATVAHLLVIWEWNEWNTHTHQTTTTTSAAAIQKQEHTREQPRENVAYENAGQSERMERHHTRRVRWKPTFLWWVRIDSARLMYCWFV